MSNNNNLIGATGGGGDGDKDKKRNNAGRGGGPPPPQMQDFAEKLRCAASSAKVDRKANSTVDTRKPVARFENEAEANVEAWYMPAIMAVVKTRDAFWNDGPGEAPQCAELIEWIQVKKPKDVKKFVLHNWGLLLAAGKDKGLRMLKDSYSGSEAPYPTWSQLTAAGFTAMLTAEFTVKSKGGQPETRKIGRHDLKPYVLKQSFRWATNARERAEQEVAEKDAQRKAEEGKLKKKERESVPLAAPSLDSGSVVLPDKRVAELRGAMKGLNAMNQSALQSLKVTQAKIGAPKKDALVGTLRALLPRNLTAMIKAKSATCEPHKEAIREVLQGLMTFLRKWSPDVDWSKVEEAPPPDSEDFLLLMALLNYRGRAHWEWLSQEEGEEDRLDLGELDPFGDNPVGASPAQSVHSEDVGSAGSGVGGGAGSDGSAAGGACATAGAAESVAEEAEDGDGGESDTSIKKGSRKKKPPPPPPPDGADKGGGGRRDNDDGGDGDDDAGASGGPSNGGSGGAAGRRQRPRGRGQGRGQGGDWQWNDKQGWKRPVLEATTIPLSQIGEVKAIASYIESQGVGRVFQRYGLPDGLTPHRVEFLGSAPVDAGCGCRPYDEDGDPFFVRKGEPSYHCERCRVYTDWSDCCCFVHLGDRWDSMDKARSVSFQEVLTVVRYSGPVPLRDGVDWKEAVPRFQALPSAISQAGWSPFHRNAPNIRGDILTVLFPSMEVHGPVAARPGAGDAAGGCPSTSRESFQNFSGVGRKLAEVAPTNLDVAKKMKDSRWFFDQVRGLVQRAPLHQKQIAEALVKQCGSDLLEQLVPGATMNQGIIGKFARIHPELVFDPTTKMVSAVESNHEFGNRILEDARMKTKRARDAAPSLHGWKSGFLM